MEESRTPLLGPRLNRLDRSMADQEAVIRSIGAGGFGVGDLPDGKVVFVPRTAPGDRVRIRLVQEKPRWARGEVIARLEDGAGRRKAPCPLYSRCDGCSLQHLDYGEQVRWKGILVGEALRRLGGLDLADPEVVPAPLELHYRNRVTFTLRRLPGGRVVAGFRELGHRGRVLDLGSPCLLPEDPIWATWESLRGQWGDNAEHLPGGKQIRLTLQRGEAGVSLLVHGGRGPGNPEALLERVQGLTSVWHERKGERAKLLAGDQVIRIAWGQESVELRGHGFVQVNSTAGKLLYEHVQGEIGNAEGRKIVDAYCGIGILGRTLARNGAEVTGIDVDPFGQLEGEAPDGVGFRRVTGRVEQELGRLLPADVVILNPPRAGLDPAVPEALNAKPSETVIYVSCDPATLARDLGRMAGTYRVDRVRSFDLFPQTGHVETVVTLREVDQGNS